MSAQKTGANLVGSPRLDSSADITGVIADPARLPLALILRAGGGQLRLGRGAAGGVESELLLPLDFLHADGNRVLALEGAFEQLFGERILQQVLDGPAE